MKTFNVKLLFLLLFYNTLTASAGRIYDEFENIWQIKWIGNYKIVSGETEDWAKRDGDVYRLAIDNSTSYSYAVYELEPTQRIHQIIVDFYAPSSYNPTLAVKNAEGYETKYVQGWDTGYPEIITKGNNTYRFVLKDDLIPEDARQAVIYLDANSDTELMRCIIDYDDGYQPIDINAETNYYRVNQLINKAKQGKDITIGVIGGSITAGANAEPMASNCYVARIKAWFEEKYNINVNLINIGIGSTNSYFGCIRAEEKLLRYNPDMIVVEYAVNDQEDDDYLSFYEGLIRKCLKAPGEPAVVALTMCTQAGITRSDQQIAIARHYNIPVCSYNDVIKNEIIDGYKTWLDYYKSSSLIGGDGVHPNNAGHQKAADIITEQLVKGENTESIRISSLPTPKYNNYFEDACYLSNTDIVPIKIGEWTDGGTIWDFGTGKGWRSEKAGSELQFKINGDVAAVTFWKRPLNENFGTAQIWVDNNAPVTIDGSNGEYIDQHVLYNLGAGEHTLHIKLLENKKFEIVCIAVSGNRSFYSGSYHLRNNGNSLNLLIDGKRVTMSENGTEFDISYTDGYLTFGYDNKYLSVNSSDGSLEMAKDFTDAAKFILADKGEKYALRSVTTGKYLHQENNALFATSPGYSDNDYFTFHKKGIDTGISNINIAKIDCKFSPNLISVHNAEGNTMYIYDISGKLVQKKPINSDNETIMLASGCYLVLIAGKAYKCNI